MENNVKQMETALLTEHFRYTPMTLLDEIVNTMNEVVNKAIDAAEQGLLATDPAVLGFTDKFEALKKARAKARREGCPEAESQQDESAETLAQNEIEQGVYQLETLLNSTIDRIFDMFEIYVLRNLLSIPEELLPWIRLEHYKELDFSAPDESEPTQEDIRALARKLGESRKLEAALQREIATNNVLLSELDFLLNGSKQPGADGDQAKTDGADQPQRPSVSFLVSGESAKTVGVSFNKPLASSIGHSSLNSLQTHTSFVMTQLSHLEKLLEYLRLKLQDPPFSSNGGSHLVSASQVSEKDDVSLRKAYLESRSRKIVSRYGMGLAGPNGSIPGISGATTADLGRHPTEEELDALESLAVPLELQEEGGAGID